MPSQSTCAFNTTSALLFQAVEEIASGNETPVTLRLIPRPLTHSKSSLRDKTMVLHGGDIDDAGSL